jgi:predicted Rossmann-fold nucleotide-binding protein
MLTWSQLGFHRKPVVVLDVADFFAPLFALADGAVVAGFLKDGHRSLAVRAATVDEALAALDAPPPPLQPKWIDRVEQT